MPIKNIADTSDNERPELFIHIKELPWLAYHRDVKELFHGLSVKEGGILIRHHSAFVAFDDPLDIDVAMDQEKRVLLGSEVKLCIINRAELRRLLFCFAKRKLDFNEQDDISKTSRSMTEKPRKKKIRPTPVIKSKKRKIEDSLTFCPKESELPPPTYEKGVKLVSWVSYNDEFLPHKKKKIHPVRLSECISTENFSIFHPDICYDIQNMILDVS